MEPESGSMVRKCQPGGHGVDMKLSFSYQGCSKKDGCCRGFTPTLVFIFESVRADPSAGVGNPKSRSAVETTGVVARVTRSASVKWQAIPSAANRCSTCAGVKEIESDIIICCMLACGKVVFRLHRPRKVV